MVVKTDACHSVLFFSTKSRLSFVTLCGRSRTAHTLETSKYRRIALACPTPRENSFSGLPIPWIYLHQQNVSSYLLTYSDPSSLLSLPHSLCHSLSRHAVGSPRTISQKFTTYSCTFPGNSRRIWSEYCQRLFVFCASLLVLRNVLLTERRQLPSTVIRQ